MCVKAILSKFISNFQVHVGAATNHSVVPWGGAAFSTTQFCREELLTNIADMKGFRLSIGETAHLQSHSNRWTAIWNGMMEWKMEWNGTVNIHSCS